MTRHFSSNRFKNFVIYITAISIFVAFFSQYYSGVYKIYEEKVKYCDDKLKGEYVYVISDCYDPERKIYHFWLDIQYGSPKVAVSIVVIDLIIFCLYKYLFPKNIKDLSTKKGGEKY